MRTVTKVAAMQRQAVQWRRQGVRIGFVPTMGYLHEGHMSLVRRARKAIGQGGRVVVSIYVNPTQFGPREDFSRYPRDLKRDDELCRREGVDVIFAPSDVEIYSRPFSTFVVEEEISQSMEGHSRPGHFRGVTTIVAKLFNIVLPDVAIFGAKDYQQAAVVQRMVRDLNFPLRVIVSDTTREKDGLAMSSRNKYLVGGLRAQALVLWQSIKKVQALVKKKRRLNAAALKEQLQKFIELQPDAKVDYIEFFDPGTLKAMNDVSADTHMALAVFVGNTRLIDNARL
ncbi:MAG TPA: pantoate--beta-alanine ligase [Verrucomicrobiae bacterium]|nr:pantoate--beta-alanine ligase [Verrucomicrobiae bacterium]